MPSNWLYLAQSTVVATVLVAFSCLAPAGPAGAEDTPSEALVEAMLRAAKSELPAGRAVVRVEESVHPEFRRIATADGQKPESLLAMAGVALAKRRVEWTWSERAVRLEAMIEEGGPYQEVVYTYDGHAGILWNRSEGAAGVRASRALESYVWGVHPRSYGRPFFGLSEEESATLRQALRDLGSATLDGRPVRLLAYSDPWQPQDHRLWVDPALGGLARRQVTTFRDSEERVRTVTIEETRDVNGTVLPLSVVEELDFGDPEDGGPRIPLKLRRTVVEDLEVPADVPPAAFYQELPAGTHVSNDVLDLDYQVGEEKLGEAELSALVAKLERGEIAARSEPRGDLGSGDRGVDVRCGVFALFAAGRLLGGPDVSLAEVERMTGFNQVGSNLAGLTRGAGALGLSATGLVTTLETVEERDWMGIAYLDGRHFVLLVEVDGDGVVVLDAPSPPQRWSREEFSERWDGVLLRLERTER